MAFYPPRAWLALLCVLMIPPCRLADDATCATEGTCQNPKTPSCGLYLAESTIPGAGLGIFTADAKTAGDTVGTGDVCLPVIDLYWHNDDESENPWRDYFWMGAVMGMSHESNHDDTEALCPGLDCIVNGHALPNLAKATPEYDDGNFNLDKDPGAGAFTPYHNGTTVVTRDIPAGGELFKFYGDEWFRGRTEVLGNLPLSTNYKEAEELLGRFFDLPVEEKTGEVLQDLYSLLAGAVGGSSRTMNALPDSFTDAQTAHLSGLTDLVQKRHTRDITWLKENGVCLDHIRPGESTIPQAGHGAFATRDLPANTVITISPLHHFVDFQYLNQYNFTESQTYPGTWYRMVDEVVSMQLSYNYCFGDSESSMILCPYGAGVSYINHQQARANVKVQWARKFHNHEIVESATLEDLEETLKSQLAFEYVATKDIKQGDELFMDYGDDWQMAWLTHMIHYKNVSYPNYISAQQFNRLYKNTPLRTREQLKYDPYPDNLQLRCHSALKRKPAVMSAEYMWQSKDRGVPCRVLHRFVEGLDLYTVQLELYLGSERALPAVDPALVKDVDSFIWLMRTDVPRSALRFFDRPYTTSLSRPTAFRHEIGIPREIFPERWRNMKP